MGFKKYKYYFSKPKSEITKDILKALLFGGVILIAATSPYFIVNILNGRKRWKEYPKKKIADTFYNLKRQGLIDINYKNNQIYISLTEEGRKKAGLFQINDLKIKKPEKWDKKWRIVIFDINELQKTHREAFRGKLKELGFISLQKSVWIHPFVCDAEIQLLRKFFGLNENDIRLITAVNIENDKNLKETFNLS